MDYEKAYKAVLETATQWIEDGCTDKEKICLESVFPELRESEDEDERIIEGFYTLIRGIRRDGGLTLNKVPLDKCEAWLEKQKESLHDSEMCKENADSFTDEDERIRKHIINLIKDNAKSKGIPCDVEIAYLEKQKEQKVDIDKLRRDIYQSGYNDGYRHGKEDAQKEQKPAEWSEFDKGVLGDAICATDILGNDESFNKGNPNLGKAFRVAKDWLESLPKRFNLEPKQEWREEDEKMLADISWAIRHCAYNDKKKKQVHDWFENRFKSLRPQPHTVSIKDATKFGNLEYERGVKDGIQSEKSRHWKPSKEQMEALRSAVNKLAKTDVADSVRLSIMYDNLKKLM